MGVSGSGVFDNDWTADFAIEFDHTAPAKRIELLRDALQQAHDADDEDLEEYAGPAIASAAIIASTLPDGPALDGSGQAPQSLNAGLTVPTELIPLALRAFDRVVTDEPEYAEMAQDPTFSPHLNAVRQTLSVHARRP